jgi:hypothetical protein
MRTYEELIARGLAGHGVYLSQSRKAKLVELVLRTVGPAEIGEAAKAFIFQWNRLHWARNSILRLLRTVFNEVSLSPYTSFVRNALAFVDALSIQGTISQDEITDFLSYLLRQTARHLTAYDLFTFHHRGANYPDAQLLDEVLRVYLARIEKHPDLFLKTQNDEPGTAAQKRIRRRALRQSLLFWHIYKDLPVPDLPTSPGENARILPTPFTRVPDEQILNSSKRVKRLFAGADLALERPAFSEAIDHSLADLKYPEEVQELGMAVYLDRPLGVSKSPTEADQTLLLSYELFSRSQAMGRLRFLEQVPCFASLRSHLRGPAEIEVRLPENGLPLRLNPGGQRPGAVALEDAAKIADDFVGLKTTTQSAVEFLGVFDFGPVADRFPCCFPFLSAKLPVVIIRANALEEHASNIITIFDNELRRRLELEVDLSRGFCSREGVERPRAGLRVLRAWVPGETSDELVEHDLQPEQITLPIRDLAVFDPIRNFSQRRIDFSP